MNYLDVIKSVLIGNKEYEYSEFCNALKELIKECIRDIGYNPDESIIEFSNLGKRYYGKVINKQDIYINYSVIRELYNCENIVENLHTIFHEISHVKQNYDMENGVSDENTIRLIMEHCILTYQISENIRNKNNRKPTYYYNNYRTSFVEADANINGINRTIDFILSNEIEISKEEYERLKFKLEYYKNKLNESISTSRYVGDFYIFNSKYLSLEEIFKFLFKFNQQWEIMFPQLVIYKTDDHTLKL